MVLVAAIVLIFGLLGDALTTQFTFTNTPESQRGVDLIEELRGLPRSTNEVVTVQSDNFGVDDPEFRQLVESLYTELRALGPGVIRQDTLIHYYQFQAPFLVSEDRRATIIPFTMAGNFDDATDNIEKVVELVESAEKQAGLEVLITGQATAGKDFQEVGQSDLEKGEAYGVPIALVILVVVLGAVVAALVPVVLAFVAILIAMGVAALVGQAFALSFFVTNIIFMIGLAVGIDYSLFIIARYREERARGLDKHAAIARAGSTASRAVFFSGMTVVLALIGMVLIPFNIYIRGRHRRHSRGHRLRLCCPDPAPGVSRPAGRPDQLAYDSLDRQGRGVRRQNKWDKRGAFEACNLDANRLRQFSDLPTSVRLDSFASPPVSSPVWRLAVRGTYPPA